MTGEDADKRLKEFIENTVREQIKELVQICITCPYCGKKYSIDKLGNLGEGETK